MELSKHYDPDPVEDKWYAHWMDRGYFTSRPDERPAFSVVIPPPNVTGVLHMGHTLNETVQDILVRRARMSGFNACWVPGSDHASIATEAKLVEMLASEGLHKQDLGRQRYLERAFAWKEKYGGIIYQQIRKLGCSVDWQRVTFTLDSDYSAAVLRVFAELYEKKLIYRGARMIHWDPAARTALSDEEVEYREVQGKLYYVVYAITGADGKPLSSQGLVIATQRPETIMGDTAVCVNPRDERYRHWIGQWARVPLVNRIVPIIADEYVDPAFGTGVLKITPAHDVNDYNLGLKHQLPVINTLNEDGTLSAESEIFVGMDRFDARAAVIARLKAEGLLVREEDHITRVGYSQRSHSVVEPRISTQWFARMRALAGPALQAVQEGKVRIHPNEKYLASYTYWMENIEDWCISRQLWWGQRIPAWYDERGQVVVAPTEEQALARYLAQHPEVNNPILRQDEDVLDTWFSSWLWPIEVFHGISQPGNPDFNYYYPTSVLVTGQDIIFFWVARMIMAGYAFTDREPFRDVYFTGMVRDTQGRKMSKSLGNSPELLELIRRYGADAVRFGIMISSPAGNDLLFDEAGLEQGRNFNNKIWNALKLIKGWEERLAEEELPGEAEGSAFATTWFEHRLRESQVLIREQFESFRISEALKSLYSLIWDDFCSWYLEWIKPLPNATMGRQTYEKTILYFEQLLQLLHSFMPFITEEIYHLLKKRSEMDDLCILQLKSIATANKAVLLEGVLLKEIITTIRNQQAKGIWKAASTFYISNRQHKKFIPILSKSVKLGVALVDKNELPAASIAYHIEGNIFHVESTDGFDTSLQKSEIQKEILYYEGFLKSVNLKLGNPNFIRNASPEVVAHEEKKKADAEKKIQNLMERMAQLSS